jgi:hypothetical protein
VGGVSGRAGAKAEGVLPFANPPLRVVTVKGILVIGKAAPFAGRRRNAGLGRSVERSGYPPAATLAPMTADVRRFSEEGNDVAHALEAHAPANAREIVASARQTRPSLGPSTRARRSSLCTWWETTSWWGVRFGITVG